MRRRLDALRLSTMLSMAVAITAMACDGNRTALFDPNPGAEDAGSISDASRDVSESPSSTTDGGGIVDAGEDAEPLDFDGGDGTIPDSGDAEGGDDPEPLDPDAGDDAGDGDASEPFPEAGVRCSSAENCDDGIACTVDVCEDGICRHSLTSGAGSSACPVGQYCDPTKGCVPGIVCATDAQCQEALGGDPCKADIYCHTVTATCQYSILDNDGDGDPPIACGGRDCNDVDPYVNGSQPEVCDGKDNDGAIDEDDVCNIGPDTCGIDSCPEPFYAGFLKCCTNDATCGFKNGPSGYCYDVVDEPDGGGGGAGGGMP